MRKPIKSGEDFVRDSNWNPVIRDRSGAVSFGFRAMPPDLKAMGFGCSVCDCGDYYRISYGRKV